jgi:hypothetical protein
MQPTNTEFATLADNGTVAEGSSVLLQLKQQGHPML